jgi:hypothetical protein
MEFNYTGQEIGKKYFSTGCPNCGSDVLFLPFSEVFGHEKEGRYVFVCSDPDCDSYVFAHDQTKSNGVQYEPMGILANKELRSLHDYCRSLFAVLWMAQDGSPAFINYVFPPLVLSFYDESGAKRLGCVNNLDRPNRLYEMETEDGKAYNIPINETNRIDLRSKAYFYLAKSLGVLVREAQIPMMDFDLTCSAIDVLKQSVKDIPIKDSNNQ